MKNMEHLRDLQNQFSKEFFLREFAPVKTVYIDLMCLQDFNLGTVLVNLKSQEQFDYVFKQMDKYNARTDNHMLTHFPDLPLKEEDLLNFQKDKLHSKLLAHMSPFTDFVHKLHVIINAVQVHNERTQEKNNPWNVLFNTYPLRYPQHMGREVANIIRSKFPHVKVGFVNKHMLNIDEATWRGCDLLCLNDIATFVGYSSPITTKLLFEEMFWMNKFIFATTRTADDVKFANEKEKSQSLKMTKDILRLSCEFDFVDNLVLLEESATD